MLRRRHDIGGDRLGDGTDHDAGDACRAEGARGCRRNGAVAGYRHGYRLGHVILAAGQGLLSGDETPEAVMEKVRAAAKETLAQR